MMRRLVQPPLSKAEIQEYGVALRVISDLYSGVYEDKNCISKPKAATNLQENTQL